MTSDNDRTRTTLDEAIRILTEAPVDVLRAAGAALTREQQTKLRHLVNAATRWR